MEAIKTDPYLVQGASYKRLKEESEKYGSLLVAVDFDDTLYDFHKKGREYNLMIQLIRDLYFKGHYIIIWTGNQDIEFIKSYLDLHQIPYNSINDEAPVSKERLGNNIPRKVYASVYIDDRAGMLQVYNELRQLLDEIK